MTAVHSISSTCFVAAHLGVDLDIGVGGVTHECCGDETGRHTRAGPLMKLEDGSQRKARLDDKCGEKYDREVDAGSVN